MASNDTTNNLSADSPANKKHNNNNNGAFDRSHQYDVDLDASTANNNSIVILLNN